MESQKKDTLLNEANCYLSYAERELNHPQEDVVTYCACHFTRKSVTDFLKAFLSEKGKNVEAAETLEELYARCMKLEPGFEAIDISCFACKCDNTEDEKYCLSVNHINKCYTKAKEIKGMVLGSSNFPVSDIINKTS